MYYINFLIMIVYIHIYIYIYIYIYYINHIYGFFLKVYNINSLIILHLKQFIILRLNINKFI